MSGFSPDIERKWSVALGWVQRFYPWHRNLFIALNVALTIANVLTGPPWWGIWPLLITGLIFAIHYLVYKASVIDDDWVEERAADLYYKSYDQGHIDEIADRNKMEKVMDRMAEKARASSRGQRPTDDGRRGPSQSDKQD